MVSLAKWFKKNWSYKPVAEETWSKQDEKWWDCKNKRECPWPNLCKVGDCKWRGDFEDDDVSVLRK